MAEPEILDNTRCHPCIEHKRRPTVTYYAWRSPSFVVNCYESGAYARDGYGRTAEEAIAAWNAQHAEWDFAAYEARMVREKAEYAVRLEEAKTSLDEPFLVLLSILSALYPSDGDENCEKSFVTWCYELAGIPEPIPDE